MVSLIAIILPISIYNFNETMNNVEAMASAGDDYSARECMLVDCCGIMLGSLLDVPVIAPILFLQGLVGPPPKKM